MSEYQLVLLASDTNNGVRSDAAREQIDEAEELLIKAWTATNVNHHGRHWQTSFPSIQPPPFQRPHPPLYRTCVSPESVVSMAKQGRLVLFRTRSAEQALEHIDLYRNTMLSSGYDEKAVERNLSQCWMWREAYVAESDEQAIDEFAPGYEHYQAMLMATQAEWNPPDQPPPEFPKRGLKERFEYNPNKLDPLVKTRFEEVPAI